MSKIIKSFRELPGAIRGASQGATIVVRTGTLKELGERAAAVGRLNRPDLTFVVNEDGSR